MLLRLKVRSGHTTHFLLVVRVGHLFLRIHSSSRRDVEHQYFHLCVQLMSALKTGAVSSSRFAKAAEHSEAIAVKSAVLRSSGGL